MVIYNNYFFDRASSFGDIGKQALMSISAGGRITGGFDGKGVRGLLLNASLILVVDRSNWKNDKINIEISCNSISLLL